VRVLQVSNFYPPYWVGGYEQIAEWIASGLRERGHHVEVLTGRGPAFDGRPEIHGELDLDLADLPATYFRTGMTFHDGAAGRFRRHVFSPANYRAARRVIAAVRPDVVSFWNPAFVSFSPLLAARHAGVPAVVHLSDTTANVFRNPHPPIGNPALRAAARAAVDLVLRSARPDRFVVPSHFLKRKLVAGEGLPEARMDVLHWPVEPTVSGGPPPVRGAAARTRLLFVGTLIAEKGVDVLLAAFADALRSRADLTLTIAGDGPAASVESLRQKARGLPVTFAGRLDRAAVTRAYAAHDVLAFPSVWDEPYAVVPPEAMAMGLVVIGTRAGGTPEAVVHEETGLLVPPRDPAALAAAILRVASDGALAERLAAAGQRWARETQSFPAFMDRLERLYGALAKRAVVPRVAAGAGRVLVVEDRIPAADRGAGYPRSWALVEMLAALGYAVTLFPYLDRAGHQPWLRQLQVAGVEVMTRAWWFRGFAARRRGSYDAVVVSRPHNFRDVRRALRRFFPHAALIYDAEALYYAREKLKAAAAGAPWRGEGQERDELALMREADVILMVSEHEKAIVAAGAPDLAARVRVWGHPVVAAPTTTPFDRRKGLLFVGGFQTSPSPNEDAVAWLVREMLPRLRGRLDATLRVAGFRSVEALRTQASPALEVVGSVDDLTALYESSRVFVVPHLYAAGIPLKLCEAMGRGVPAVVSELIARQLGVEDGREVLIGRTPDEYADKVVALYEDERLWLRLREAGLEFVRAHHDPRALAAGLDAVMKDAIAGARAGAS
jgi:glycosyltransferase involved in cell wall biosynthesis